MGRRPMCVLCLLLIAFLCLGDRMGMPLIRGNPLPDNLRAWIEKHPDSSACGVVERCVDTEISQSVYLKDVYLIYNSKKVSIGNVRVFLKEKEELPVGSVILVSGELEEVAEPRNPGEFDSRQYYACWHIYYFMKKAVVEKKSVSYSEYGQFLVSFRGKLANVLRTSAGKAAPVFEAMVLGDKGDLESETKLRYQMAGIIHILAISGLHISVLGMGLYQILKKIGLGIWSAGMLALVIMLQYGMMTGGGVSTMRAVSMFLLAVGAKILGRIYDMPTALAVSAILILAESPAYLLDGGFWLSFGAVIGIGAAAPRFDDVFCAKGNMGKAFISSAAVQITTLPVMLWFYGELSVAGIFLNLVVLPTVGVVLVSGVGTAIVGLMSLSAAAVCALPGRVLLAVYEWLCKVAARVPFCTWVGGKPQMWQIVVYYVILIFIVVYGSRVLVRTGVWGMRCVCIVLLIIGVLILSHRPSGGLRITCLDIGQGDAIVVETPDDRIFLIDGGSSNKLGIGQYQILPFLKSRGISYVDAIFISHTDEDHISGIRELLEYMSQGLTSLKAGHLILPGWEKPPEAWEELAALADSAGVEVLTGNAGKVFHSGDLKFKVLSPAKGASGEEVNEEAMVMQLEYGEFQALFTGDIGAETEKKLLNDLEDVDMLKVAHHGSRYSTSEAFLEKIKPEISVISVSSTNTYGHPSPETIDRLEAAGSQVEYTMKSGAVTVVVGEEDGGVMVEMFVG